MKNITALAVCATYGRLPYLGRMLSSFLHQTYKDKHLVVINDDNNVQLCCGHDNVTVINCSTRMKIGEKRNLGAVFKHFDVIFPWDDDDIFFPNRIANHMKQYESESVRAYRNYAAYTLYNGTFCSDEGGVNNKSYRRSEWFSCGGYGDVGIIGEDLELHNKLQGFRLETNPNERDFMYGFSTSNYHLSNQPQNLEEIALSQLEKMNLVGKKFWIEPDFEEYNKYLTLDSLFKKHQQPMKVGILEDGKIDISHLI